MQDSETFSLNVSRFHSGPYKCLYKEWQYNSEIFFVMVLRLGSTKFVVEDVKGTLRLNSSISLLWLIKRESF